MFLAHGQYGALDELIPLVIMGAILLLIAIPAWRWMNKADEEAVQDTTETTPPIE